MTEPPTPPDSAGLRRALPSIAIALSLVASLATVAVAFTPPEIYSDFLPVDGAADSVNGRDGPWWQLEQALIKSGSVRQASVIGAIAVESPRTRDEAAASYLRATLAGPVAADAEVLLVADQGSVRFVGAGRRNNSFVTFAPGVVIITERGRPAAQQTVTMISSDAPAGETTVEVTTTQEEVDGCREAGFRVPASGASVLVRLCRGRGLTAARWETRVGPVIEVAVSPEPVLTGVGAADLANRLRTGPAPQAGVPGRCPGRSRSARPRSADPGCRPRRWSTATGSWWYRPPPARIWTRTPWSSRS